MALVLRKAVITKNVSFLKCMKGRHFVSSANKKNPAATTAACPRRRYWEKSMLCGCVWKIETARTKCSRSSCKTTKTLRNRLCFSCPDLGTKGRVAQRPLPRFHSPPARASSQTFAPSRNILPLFLNPARTLTTLSRGYSAAERASCPVSKPKLVPFQPKAYRNFERTYTCKCGCGCPFPCGPYGCGCGCGCLPPPCNTPPRCIQYMTGYYYYPYGFWFCGPYHVSGLCCPVSGSCPCGCGCGCGCGPCGKCCACCVCPAIAGAAIAAGIPGAEPQNMPTGPKLPGKGAPGTPSLKNFFPFSTTVSPIQATKNKKIVQGSGMKIENKRKNAKGSQKLSGSSRSFTTSVDFSQAHEVVDKGGSYSTSMKSRKIPTAEERDQPNIYPGQFHLGSVPKYINPYPYHKPLHEMPNPTKDEA